MQPNENEDDAVWVRITRDHWNLEFEVEPGAAEETVLPGLTCAAGEKEGEGDAPAPTCLDRLGQELTWRWTDLCVRWHFATW